MRGRHSAQVEDEHEHCGGCLFAPRAPPDAAPPLWEEVLGRLQPRFSSPCPYALPLVGDGRQYVPASAALRLRPRTLRLTPLARSDSQEAVAA